MILFDGKESWIKADPGQIRQVLLNLAINARDAMPGGGKIIITVAHCTGSGESNDRQVQSPGGDEVLLTISDNGTGMTEEVKARIFDPFFTTKEVGQGTGLGLASSHGIIRRIGGHIEVQSKVGQGSSFNIYLPGFNAPQEKFSDYKTVGDLRRGTETVLLVEDEPLVRAMAAITLREQGYTVLEANNGEEALRVAQQNAETEIHLLLSDAIMPQMDGIETAVKFSAIRPDTRILLMSGYASDATDENGQLGQDVAFISKPFTPSGLADKVRFVLDR